MQDNVLQKLTEMQLGFVEDLQEFIQHPSVASQDRGVEECAKWLIQFIKGLGIDPIVERNGGYPVIMAEIPGDSQRSLLLYAHYDVQPADEPEWRTDPYSGEIINGRMYGRGTVDNKGPLMAILEAIRLYRECGKRPPVTVKLLFEGEEEIGSPSLIPLVKKHGKFLHCDGLANFDDSVWHDGRPRVVGGIKGVCMLRITVRSKREFHAMMAPLIENPLWRLVQILSLMIDASGRILIPGFYDDVRPPSKEDLKALEALNWSGEQLLEESGQAEFLGTRSGVEALRFWLLEPNIHLQGIHGGYLPPDRKGVVPTEAVAELRIGTVPDQTQEKIIRTIRQFFDQKGFGDAEVEVFASKPWSRSPLEGPLVQAMVRSLEAAFSRGVALQPSFGGSGPEGSFQKLFPDMEQAFSGFGPPEDVIHAPNEYIVVDDYLKGIESIARLLWEYAAEQ
jgi:acetylornithine deacetylase/succinyl-diaminopimelate desuccinylase-like protein